MSIGEGETSELPSAARILAHARLAAKSVSEFVHSTDEMVNLCADILAGKATLGKTSEFGAIISNLPVDHLHYWVGTFYALMLPEKERRKNAAYFTPPHLANAVLDLAIEAGFDPTSHDVLDPAAGGAAFLSIIAARMLRLGVSATDIAYRLNGIEIDPGLARISKMLIEARLDGDLDREVPLVEDALNIHISASYNLVIANPPYGRISPSGLMNDSWREIAHSGHINKYAVFTDLCFRVTKPGGLIALVIPSSFRAGPLYDRMRTYIRARGQVLTIGLVESRNGVFVDVAQDVSVLIVRKGVPHDADIPVSFPVMSPSATRTQTLFHPLPDKAELPWSIPMVEDSPHGEATLKDYGVTVRAGYFVWNRERDRLVNEPVDGAFPLVWSKNIKPGFPCVPSGKKGDKVDFVVFKADSQAIVREHAAVMQRTTNEKQPRRLVTAIVSPSVVERWGGFVTENHTIVLTGDNLEKLELAVALLNTKPVDERYRRVSGTAAVSVKLLREIDLPKPDMFRAALKVSGGDIEKAARLAYDNLRSQDQFEEVL